MCYTRINKCQRGGIFYKNKSQKKNVLLLVLILLIVGIAVGYAGYSQTLKITGTANIVSDWNVHINSIEEGTLVGATKQYTVTATWSADDTTVPTTTTKTVTINLNYVQDTAN